MAPCLMINLVTIVMHHHHHYQHQGGTHVFYTVTMVTAMVIVTVVMVTTVVMATVVGVIMITSVMLLSSSLHHLGTTVSLILTWPGKNNIKTSHQHNNFIMCCCNVYLHVLQPLCHCGWCVYILHM